MKTRALQALILSTGLSSGAVLSEWELRLRPIIGQTQERTTQVLVGKKGMDRLRLEIEGNTGTYEVRKNDTVALIASTVGISIDELVELNNFLGSPLFVRGKSGTDILIKPGQKIFTPKDTKLFQEHIDRIAEYTRVGKLNEQVLAGKVSEIDMEPVFASSVQSVGLPNYLSGFIQSQQISYDPNHPRVVDRAWESQVTCANAMRTLMGQSMNIADLKPQEQAFQRKQNVDAWMLPTELMNMGYEQKFGEIMSMFDSQSIGSADPIKKERLSEYRETIKSMNAYLEKNGETSVGGFVPYYFKRSHYKWVVGDYNRWRKDKHYNTHQSMFAGNTSMHFGAWNTGVIKDGKMEAFGADKKILPEEIARLRKDLEKIQKDMEPIVAKLVQLSDPTTSNEMRKKLSRHLIAIEPIINASKITSEADRLKKQWDLIALLKKWNDTKSPSTEDEIKKMIPWHAIGAADLEYLWSLASNASEQKRMGELFRKTIVGKNTKVIDGTKFGSTIANDPSIGAALNEYNSLIEREAKTKNLLQAKELLEKKPNEGIRSIDFILNFVQSRSDFGGSLSEGFRKEILNGLSVYGDILNIKVNGKSLNIMEELQSYKDPKKKGTVIMPEDMIEITGPMMIDGEKQSTHADISRQKTMNIRTRFFFEFFLSETYLPSELLVPGANSSYAIKNFPTHSGNLKVKGVYGLRMIYGPDGEIMRNKNNQALSENIEEVLMREIVAYENLSPKDPRFTEKLRKYYGLQIKALQIAGFLQDENTLNKGGVNINRAIPYYDPTNINEVYASFFRTKKQDIHSLNTRLAEMKNFINIQTFPEDTYRQIFSSIIRYIGALGETKSGYPYMSQLIRLQDYKKRIFVERFLWAGSPEADFNARKFLENPKPFKHFIMTFDALEWLSREIVETAYIEDFPGIREIDEKAISLASDDESYKRMLRNILAIESYGETGSIFSRKNIKKLAKKIGYGSSLGDYQLRIHSLFADLENDKTLPQSIASLVQTINKPETQSYLASFQGEEKKEIEKDLALVKEIENILRQTKNGEVPKKAIADILTPIIRFDEGNGSNVVGKIISASLLIDKLALHSEKLDYMLVSAGYDLSWILANPIIMKQYERTIIRINNLPENHMLLALAENFVLRLTESVLDIYVPTKTVFNESMFSKGKYLGQIRYDRNIFMSHLKDYRDLIFSREPTFERIFIGKRINALIESLEKSPNNTNEVIYNFFRNSEIQAFMKKESIDNSPLPLEEEWNKDPFRSSVFNYVNKLKTLREKAKNKGNEEKPKEGGSFFGNIFNLGKK